MDDGPRTRENLPYEVSPVDDRLENGPVEERSCTDILCCLIFIIFWVALVGIGLTSFADGASKIKNIAALYDSDGMGCGLSGTATNVSTNTSVTFDYTDYPYLYYPRPIPNNIGDRICVKTCPNTVVNGALPSVLDCKTNSKVPYCAQPNLMESSSIWGMLSTGSTSNLTSNFFLIYNTSACKTHFHHLLIPF